MEATAFGELAVGADLPLDPAPLADGIAGLARTSRAKPAILGAEIAFSALAGLTAAWVVNLYEPILVVVQTMTLLFIYHLGLDAMRPGLPRFTSLVRDMALPFGVVAGGVAFFHVHPEVLRDAAAIILATTGAAAIGALARDRLLGPVRVIALGGHESVVRVATTWAGNRRAKVVGAIVADHDEIRAVGTDSVLSVPVVDDGDDIARWIEKKDADLVVVVPGPTVTNERVRRLGWQLEGGATSLSVMSPLSHVAPHRVDPVWFGDTTLIHVRSSRRTMLVRAAKYTVDRVLGALLLILFAPLLLAMVVAVRVDSRGRGFFTQTRVGLNGATFRMYKMRTMRADAEQVRDDLATLDEGNGVLFKIRNDPRITRVGALLRKTSLDELPQLINVVLGQMSLVGPRPALPAEVARYTASEQRRLQVRPGMTGLWQVSGRSNLSWERSVELDLHYVDNWRLADDLGIGVRTVDAVARSRGAY